MVGLLETKIVVTLGYSALFDFPLTTHEVWLRLMFVSKAEVTETAVAATLARLKERGLVFESSGLFSTKAPQYWVHREQRALHSQLKLAEATQMCQNIAKIPFVLAVGVTGSVAAGNAKPNDDIDFIIITKKDSLWFVRLAVVLFSVVRRKRRSWNHEEENSWCFNLWLEETQLRFSAKTPVYTSYEFCQVSWLYSRENVLNKLFEQNRWIDAVMPSWYQQQKKKWASASFKPGTTGELNWWKKASTAAVLGIMTVVNKVLFILQRAYMQHHLTNEKVAYSYAFFHPRNTPKVIVGGWKRELLDWKQGSETSKKQTSEKQWSLPNSIEVVLHQARAKNQVVVLVTGVFDIFHSEHRAFLEKAKQAGDVLLVGIESDVRVTQIKGPGRPINTQQQRQERLEREHLADGVFVLPEQFGNHEDLVSFIRVIKPQILAVSSHTAHLDHKQRIMEMVGGKVVVVHQHNPAVSTTRSLELGREL